MKERDFHATLASELITGAYSSSFQRNELRWGAEPPRSLRARVKRRIVEALARRGFARRDNASPEGLASVLRDLQLFEGAWGLFADDESRHVFERLLAMRAFGDRHVRMPIPDGGYWSDYERCRDLDGSGAPRDGGLGFELRLYDMRPFGFDLTLRCAALSVLDVFLSRQYELRRRDAIIRVERGDVVIDGGAGWGETALMFAALAGAGGRVVAIEFEPNNVNILRENLTLNPTEAGRIELVERALWSDVDADVSYSPMGTGTHIGSGDDARTTTTTIDELVHEHALPRVDFIKMDVEGSEHAALLGASETLRRFRPKLALSAYHRPHDLALLPSHLDSLDLGYRFFLDHFTSYHEETVLFAAPVGGR